MLAGKFVVAAATVVVVGIVVVVVVGFEVEQLEAGFVVVVGC